MLILSGFPATVRRWFVGWIIVLVCTMVSMSCMVVSGDRGHVMVWPCGVLMKMDGWCGGVV